MNLTCVGETADFSNMLNDNAHVYTDILLLKSTCTTFSFVNVSAFLQLQTTQFVSPFNNATDVSQ